MTPFYRLYEFDLGGGQHLFVPRPQNLGKHHYTLKEKGERLDFRISVGNIRAAR